jgi:hypothetical protein
MRKKDMKKFFLIIGLLFSLSCFAQTNTDYDIWFYTTLKPGTHIQTVLSSDSIITETTRVTLISWDGQYWGVTKTNLVNNPGRVYDTCINETDEIRNYKNQYKEKYSHVAIKGKGKVTGNNPVNPQEQKTLKHGDKLISVNLAFGIGTFDKTTWELIFSLKDEEYHTVPAKFVSTDIEKYLSDIPH